MKKFVALILVLTLLLSMTVGVAYADPKGKAVGQEKEKSAKVERSTGQDKKVFKQELNDEKREVQGEIAELERMLEEMLGTCEVEEDTDVEDNVALEGNAEAEVVEEDTPLLTEDDIRSQLALLKLQKKAIIRQRFMVVKSQYTPEELGAFADASALIADLKEKALGLGSVTVNNNILKFDTPPYIKGGRTLVPVRIISEALGADVLWNEEAQTVTIITDDSSTTTGTAIELGIGSKLAKVKGKIQILDTEAEITNGRTYVPLRFAAEAFNLDVHWDPDTETIDIIDKDPVIEEPQEEATQEEVLYE